MPGIFLFPFQTLKIPREAKALLNSLSSNEASDIHVLYFNVKQLSMTFKSKALHTS